MEFDQALPYLNRFRIRWRLAPNVWRSVANLPVETFTLERGAASDASSVRRVAHAIPDRLIKELSTGFSLSSPFWTETGYADRGYFSFWYNVADTPRNSVEFLCRHLLPLCGAAQRVVGCEWWVHTRAEGRSIGHQMHFDTEEVESYPTRYDSVSCHPVPPSAGLSRTRESAASRRELRDVCEHICRSKLRI